MAGARIGSMSDDFLLSDNLDAILNLLEEDEEIENGFFSAAENFTKTEFLSLPEICKSLGGLNRHVNSKHIKKTSKETKLFLNQETLLENIQEIQHAAIKNDCYPQKIKD